MIRSPVGLALGAIVVLGVGTVGVVLWKILGDIAKATRWGE